MVFPSIKSVEELKGGGGEDFNEDQRTQINVFSVDLGEFTVSSVQ